MRKWFRRADKTPVKADRVSSATAPRLSLGDFQTTLGPKSTDPLPSELKKGYQNLPLSTLEKLPFELLEQVVSQVPAIWQASLLRSSPHLWKLYKDQLLTTITHRAAMREFVGREPLERIFCYECASFRVRATTIGWGPGCPHAVGLRLPDQDGSLKAALPQTLPNRFRIRQSIALDFAKTELISFLQYRSLLRQVCLRPRPSLRFTDTFSFDFDLKVGQPKPSFRSLGGGLCSRAIAWMAIYPLDRLATGSALGYIRYGDYPVHICHGYQSEDHASHPENYPEVESTSLNEYIMELISRAVIDHESNNRHTYRCKLCVTEISFTITTPSTSWVRPRGDYASGSRFLASRNYLRSVSEQKPNDLNAALNLPGCFGIQIHQYTWLGAALFPHDLPQNQIGPHPGLTDSEFDELPCMKDGFDGDAYPRLHKRLGELSRSTPPRPQCVQQLAGPAPRRGRYESNERPMFLELWDS